MKVAMENNDVERIKYLFNKYVPINTVYENGETLKTCTSK